jgi:hypothetical protein
MATVKRLYILDFGLFQVHENGRLNCKRALAGPGTTAWLAPVLAN